MMDTKACQISTQYDAKAIPFDGGPRLLHGKINFASKYVIAFFVLFSSLSSSSRHFYLAIGTMCWHFSVVPKSHCFMKYRNSSMTWDLDLDLNGWRLVSSKEISIYFSFPLITRRAYPNHSIKFLRVVVKG